MTVLTTFFYLINNTPVKLSAAQIKGEYSIDILFIFLALDYKFA